MRHTVILALALVGCKKGNEEGGAGGKKVNFDASAEKAKLQGTWTRNGKTKFDIKGDDVTFSMMGNEKKGTLQLEPNKLGVKVGSATYSYVYRWDGDKLHVSMGNAVYPIASEDKFTITSNSVKKETISWDGKKCVYKKDFMKKIEKEVQCKMSEEGGHKKFHYQYPSPFKEGEWRDAELVVSGNMLMEPDLFKDSTLLSKK